MESKLCVQMWHQLLLVWYSYLPSCGNNSYSLSLSLSLSLSTYALLYFLSDHHALNLLSFPILASTYLLYLTSLSRSLTLDSPFTLTSLPLTSSHLSQSFLVLQWVVPPWPARGRWYISKVWGKMKDIVFVFLHNLFPFSVSQKMTTHFLYAEVGVVIYEAGFYVLRISSSSSKILLPTDDFFFFPFRSILPFFSLSSWTSTRLAEENEKRK